MAIEKDDLEWKVTGIKTKNETNGDGIVLPNAICQTYWTASYTDSDGNTGTFSGATPFSAANLSEDDFQLLDTLTEEIVLGWIKDIVVDGYLEHVTGMIQRQIDQLAITETAMPWAPVDDHPPSPVDPQVQ